MIIQNEQPIFGILIHKEFKLTFLEEKKYPILHRNVLLVCTPVIQIGLPDFNFTTALKTDVLGMNSVRLDNTIITCLHLLHDMKQIDAHNV